MSKKDDCFFFTTLVAILCMLCVVFLLPTRSLDCGLFDNMFAIYFYFLYYFPLVQSQKNMISALRVLRQLCQWNRDLGFVLNFRCNLMR